MARVSSRGRRLRWMEVILRRVLILSLTAIGILEAQGGYQAQAGSDDGWLRAPGVTRLQGSAIATIGDSALIGSARDELLRTLHLRSVTGVPKESAIVLSTVDNLPPEWGL